MADLLNTVILAFLVMACSSWTSAQPDHTQLTLGEETDRYTVECGEYMYFQVDAEEPCQDLRIQVNHVEGEPDLYVSRGPQKYPVFTSLAWSSYNWGSEDLTISSWDPEYQLGTYYIGVLSYCGNDVGTGVTPATFTMLVSHVESTHPHDEITQNGQVTGEIAIQSYRYYRFCLPSSCVQAEVALQNCLNPTACPTTYSYPELLVSRSIQAPTISDHAWKLASVETRSVYLRHDDPDFYPGHFFAGVYGWCTPDNLCPDLSTCGPCSYANNTEFTVALTVTEVTDCTPKQPLELCTGRAVGMTATIAVVASLFAVGSLVRVMM